MKDRSHRLSKRFDPHAMTKASARAMKPPPVHGTWIGWIQPPEERDPVALEIHGCDPQVVVSVEVPTKSRVDRVMVNQTPRRLPAGWHPQHGRRNGGLRTRMG